MSKGFIKIYRELYESDLWQDVTTKRLFLYLLIHASHKDGIKKGGITLQRGQWIRSYRKLAEDLAYKEGRGVKKYSTRTIKKCVDKLVNAGRVSIQETELGTLFTVSNYAKYQDKTDTKDESVNGTVPEGETNGKRTVNNNKNAKNAKKERKDNSRRKYDDDSPYIKMTHYLLDKIRVWKPDYVFRGSEQTWADEFRKMHEIDKRRKQDIRDVIDFATNDPFWQTNILSAKKLREKFDTLQAQMNKKLVPYKPRGGGSSATSRNLHGRNKTPNPIDPGASESPFARIVKTPI